MTERRSVIPGYPNYEVSDQGNAWSLPWVRTDSLGRQYRVPGGPLKATLHERKRKGKQTKVYRCVTIIGAEGPEMWHIANLMLLTFVGPKPFPKAVARHLDDDSLNDVLENLAWGTYADNTADAIRNGLYRGAPGGQRHPMAKLAEVDVLAIRSAVADGARQVDLAEQYGVHPQTIHRIITRQRWRSLGEEQ